MSKVLTIFCMQQKSGKFLDRLQQILRRVLSKFFEQVGHETMYASSGIKKKIAASYHRQTYLNYEQSS